MTKIRSYFRSAVAIGLGMGVLFFMARTIDEFLAQPGSVVARAFRADVQFFAAMVSLTAGYATALAARRRHLSHAGALAMIAAILCLARPYAIATGLLGDGFASAPTSFQQWLYFIASDIVPVVLVATMIWLGGVLRVWQRELNLPFGERSYSAVL